MKSVLIALSMILCLPAVIAQGPPVIEDYSAGNKELAIFPFGMDNVIIVGSLSKKGEISFNWEEVALNDIPNIEFFTADLKSLFQIYCDEELEQTVEGEDAISAHAGYIYLWNGRKWNGALTPASSKEMYDHLEDSWSYNVVEGSYLKFYYSDKPSSYNSICRTMINLGDREAVQETIYKLNFTSGWNTVRYEILETASAKDMPDQALKMLVETVEEIPEDIRWFLKEF